MQIIRTATSLLLALLLCLSAQAADSIRVEPFWLAPALPPGTTPYALPATLYWPGNWVGGDGAVILLGDPDGPSAGDLLPALLAEGAMVLELDIATSRGLAADNDHTMPPLAAEQVAPDLAIALEQLQWETGAALVVAIGSGAAGTAALAALPTSPALTAAVALRPGGVVVQARGNAAARASLAGLCNALVAQGSQLGRDAAEACRAALSGEVSHAAR